MKYNLHSTLESHNKVSECCTIVSQYNTIEVATPYDKVWKERYKKMNLQKDELEEYNQPKALWFVELAL